MEKPEACRSIRHIQSIHDLLWNGKRKGAKNMREPIYVSIPSCPTISWFSLADGRIFINTEYGRRTKDETAEKLQECAAGW